MSHAADRASPEASGWGREVSSPGAGAQRDRDLGAGSVRAAAAQDLSPAQPAARWLLHGMGPCHQLPRAAPAPQGASAVSCTPCPQLPGLCGPGWGNLASPSPLRSHRPLLCPPPVGRGFGGRAPTVPPRCRGGPRHPGALL